MKIFGKDLKKHELLRKIGDISQLGGLKYYQFMDGTARGQRAIDMKSPNGMDMTVLVDRGMDIANLSYRGIPLSWRSHTGEASAAYYESRGIEWLRTFHGGMLVTCGLTYFGVPCTDEDEELGLHGRISNLPAENVVAEGCWEDDIYKMTLKASVREAKVFGDNLELKRQISTSMDSRKIAIRDIVTNLGFRTSPFMVLYHINIGYPVLDTASKLIEPQADVTARDKEADKGIDNYFEFSEPIADFSEQVFFHDIKPDKKGFCRIALVNEAFDMGKGIGLAVKYIKEQLPYLCQWKQTGIGEYVCGLEPANSLPRGRDVERQEENLRFLRPGEKTENNLELDILYGKEDIQRFKQDVAY